MAKRKTGKKKKSFLIEGLALYCILMFFMAIFDCSSDSMAFVTTIVLIFLYIWFIIFIFKWLYKIIRFIIRKIRNKKAEESIPPTEKYREKQSYDIDISDPSTLRNRYFAPNCEEPLNDDCFKGSKSVEGVECLEEDIDNSKPITGIKEYKIPELSLLKSSERPSRELYKTAREKGEKLANELCFAGIDCVFNEASVSSTFTSIKVALKRKGDLNKFLDVADIAKKLFGIKNAYVLPYCAEENNIYVLIPNSNNYLNLESVLSRKTEDVGPLSFAIGEDFFGEAHFGDLIKTNNYLIVGNLYTGKTNLMYSIIISLLMQNSPDDLSMAIIDSKIINYVTFKDIPHLIFPIVSMDNADKIIKKLYRIKEDRVRKLSDNGIRNIESYNQKFPNQKMKQMVLFIDGIDELVASYKSLSEYLYSICSTTRITGIHVIATCLSADKSRLSDTLKNEFDGRIAFKLPNSQQSRLTIGTSGAESLSSCGEVLYKTQINDFSKRVITPCVDDGEVMNVCRFIQSQTYDGLKNVQANDDNLSFGKNDPLYNEAKEYVIAIQKASTSILQRRFGIGYNRSARIIDELEKNGVIGPSNGSNSRDVYF